MALIVIPARMGAERLPGKPLLAGTGKPLVVHTLEAARRCRRAQRVVVATDDRRIVAAVEAEGGEALLTSPDLRSGTDRVAAAARSLPGHPIVLNLQGDEPEVDPAHLDALVACMEEDAAVDMATLAAPLEPPEEFPLPSAVKVVTDARGNALYFSRAPIPHPRNPGGATPMRHVGVYGFRRPWLEAFAGLSPTPLEIAEGLEQLRALENGTPIRVVPVARAHAGIDTREDYDAFVRRWRERNG